MSNMWDEKWWSWVGLLFLHRLFPKFSRTNRIIFSENAFSQKILLWTAMLKKHLDMSLLRHFHRSHIQGGRLGSQSWSGHQGGWQCTPDVGHEKVTLSYSRDFVVSPLSLSTFCIQWWDGMGYTGDGDDDDNNWEAIVGQVMRGLAIHTFRLASCDPDQDLRSGFKI